MRLVNDSEYAGDIMLGSGAFEHEMMLYGFGEDDFHRYSYDESDFEDEHFELVTELPADDTNRRRTSTQIRRQ